MSQHNKYHYSVTMHTSDEAVLHCLRALSQYAQRNGNVRIPWGGTSKDNWILHNHCVTFRFSKPEYRKIFIKEVSCLLPKALWRIINENDNDPATPQA